MSQPVRVTIRPPRTHVYGRRVHHFWPGLILLCTGVEALQWIGVALIASDWQDRHLWVRDLIAHPA